MKITLVKKILANGNECKKCKEVTERLKENNELQYINETVYADERDYSSEGFALAKKHNVDVAPFFIVEENEKTTVYKSYMQLRKQTFGKQDGMDEKPDTDSPSAEEDPNEDLYWM